MDNSDESFQISDSFLPRLLLQNRIFVPPLNRKKLLLTKFQEEAAKREKQLVGTKEEMGEAREEL